MDTPIQPKPDKARVRVNPAMCFLNERGFAPAYDVLWQGQAIFIGHSFGRAYELAAELSSEVVAA